MPRTARTPGRVRPRTPGRRPKPGPKPKPGSSATS